MNTGIGATFFAQMGIKRFVVSIAHSQSITLNWYSSDNRGTSWQQEGTETITAPTAEKTTRDYLVEPARDWKLELVNGGSAQATFSVNMAMTDERSVAD